MLNLSDPDNPRAEAYLSSEAGLSSIKVSSDPSDNPLKKLIREIHRGSLWRVPGI